MKKLKNKKGCIKIPNLKAAFDPTYTGVNFISICRLRESSTGVPFVATDGMTYAHKINMII